MEMDFTQRVLEVEAMDTEAEAIAYDCMDHSVVNERFVQDLLATNPNCEWTLDLGTGTALIPICLCQYLPAAKIVALDLAQWMLKYAVQNVERAGFADRITPKLGDAKGIPYPTGTFTAAISNSIVHHVPEPQLVLTELVRVVNPNGQIFVRDLLRPANRQEWEHLVEQYASGCTEQQRQLFADSLRAALTLAEVRSLVTALGFPPESVQATSDRHWTWSARKPQPRE